MSATIPLGAPVAAMQYGCARWEPAVVVAHAPYLGRPGYYVSYPLAKEQWDCHGGWIPGNCIVVLDPEAPRGSP